MVTMTIDLPLDVIHKLYALAIAYNCTTDDIFNKILREYMDETLCEYDLCSDGSYKTSCGEIARYKDLEKGGKCIFCGRDIIFTSVKDSEDS